MVSIFIQNIKYQNELCIVLSIFVSENFLLANMSICWFYHCLKFTTQYWNIKIFIIFTTVEGGGCQKVATSSVVSKVSPSTHKHTNTQTPASEWWWQRGRTGGGKIEISFQGRFNVLKLKIKIFHSWLKGGRGSTQEYLYFFLRVSPARRTQIFL